MERVVKIGLSLVRGVILEKMCKQIKHVTLWLTPLPPSKLFVLYILWGGVIFSVAPPFTRATYSVDAKK